MQVTQNVGQKVFREGFLSKLNLETWVEFSQRGGGMLKGTCENQQRRQCSGLSAQNSVTRASGRGLVSHARLLGCSPRGHGGFYLVFVSGTRSPLLCMLSLAAVSRVYSSCGAWGSLSSSGVWAPLTVKHRP